MDSDCYMRLIKRWSKEEDYELEAQGMLEPKHLVCSPDGNNYFMSFEESHLWLKGCKKVGVKELRGLNLYALYDETQVVQYNGHRYLQGPAVIITDLYPYYEKDLETKEADEVRSLMWANETKIPSGLSVIETFLLDRVEARL